MIEVLSNVAATCGSFLGLPAWHTYISDSSCNIPNDLDLLGGDFWLIAVAIVEIMLRLAAYVAIIFIVYGGIRILSSSGDPNSVSDGRKSIVNAIIGFILSMMASQIVGYLGSQFEGAQNSQGAEPVTIALNIVYRIAAGVAVIYVVIAGLKFVTSSGDPAGVQQARNSIIYAIAGLVITLFAVAILRFVVGSV